MDTSVVNILNGISFAMILFLIASGFSLVYGTMGILNMAHGALYILGGYVGLTAASYGVNFWLAAIIGGVGVGLISLLLERLLSRLYGQINEQVLVTLGIVYVFENLALLVWGPYAKMGTAPAIISGSVNIGDLLFPVYRFVLIFIGLSVAIGLWLFQEKTRIGAIVRAGMENKEMTMGLGLNYGLVSGAVFILGAFISGFAGFIGAPVITVYYGMVFDILLLAVVVVVVGGVGSVSGALAGAILIGLIDSFGRAYFPDLAYFTIYLAMIIVLLVKPSGLLGRGRQ